VGCNGISLDFDGLLRGINLGFHDNNSTIRDASVFMLVAIPGIILERPNISDQSILYFQAEHGRTVMGARL
jgi:hypothetical protein